MSKCEKINELLSGYLDEELVQGDQQRVRVHLSQCENCRQVYNQMSQLRKAVSKSLSQPELSQQQWEKIMNDIPARVSRSIGWVLLIVGAITLSGFLIWHFAIDDEIPLFVKITTSAIFFGVVSLFVSVLRQRWVAQKTDRYKDVQI